MGEMRIPGKGLECRVCGVNLWAYAEETHECVAVVAGEVLCGISFVEALESERDELELAEYQVALVVVDELREVR